ncbi:transcriptional regulator [Leptospira ryugenii]|uniref:Transcriptional regulator n=1 Tax=Leptospira ryugenii TaxID=1917863 RepID=A0A2P2DVM1_9LEPT|nr:TetR/AcrR family transcriptional regulator [Leptospira ryugenii]GBF48665.1 transcriptional regulator [Leptospira ryugenii]
MKTKEKILESSFALFREKGFQATAISEILENANAYKKSLYDHFDSKEEIGFAYLEHLSRQQGIVMRKVLEKSKDMDDFIDKWINFIIRDQRNTTRKDCPIALFSGEISHLPQFEPYRNQAIQYVLQTTESCIEHFRNDLRTDTLHQIAIELYIAYLGGLRLYSLTKDRKVIERMKDQMKHTARKKNKDFF